MQLIFKEVNMNAGLYSLGRYRGKLHVCMKNIMTCVLGELLGMLQTYEVRFSTKIFYVFRINQQKLRTVGAHSV